MEVPQKSSMMPQSEQSFAEKWFTEKVELVIGVYQLIYDGQWKCVLVGDDCYRILNCTAEGFWDALTQLSVRSSYHADEMTVAAILQEMIDTRQSHSFICTRPRQDGKTQYIKGTLAVAYDAQGQLCVLGQLADISKDRDRNAQSQLTEEGLRIVMSQMGTHIAYYDIASRTLTSLAQTAQFFGVPAVIEDFPEGYLVHPALGYPADSAEILRNFIAAIHRGEPTGNCEYPVFTADGRRIWMYREFTTMFDDRGKSVHAVICTKNITKNKEQVHQQTSDYQGLVQITQTIFPLIISCNLTQNTYQILHSTTETPNATDLDAFLSAMLDSIHPEDQEAFRTRFFRTNQLKSIEEDRQCFELTYRRKNRKGNWNWVETIALLHTAPYSNDLLTIALSRYVDQEKQQEEQLKEQKMLVDIVSQHSNRTLYVYDLSTRTTRLWNSESEDQDELRHLYADTSTDEAGILKNKFILLDSVYNAAKFFENIHNGVPNGELNIHIRMEDGSLRWYHFKYSTIFSDGNPIFTLISTKDITKRHEHELAYLRYVQSIKENADNYLVYAEGCLICDHVEMIGGTLFSEEEKQATYSLGDFHRLLGKKKLHMEEYGKFVAVNGNNALLKMYESGQQSFTSDFKASILGDTPRWLRLEMTMMPDPFNRHVKVFVHILDINEEKETQLSIQHQAEYDAMTGLLRRDAGEVRIREHLAAHTRPGGILIMIDMDDLKGINDTYGHQYGDEAIKSVAETIKKHFRKDDLLIRIGGDEFIVFLPRAGNSVHSIELTLTALLKELSSISVGIGRKRNIHCSIGCAVELTDTDTFDSLYQRADMALYHVKRNGKNNYAFFDPEMLEASYRFKMKQATSAIASHAKKNALEGLLEIVSTEYPGIVHFNLTQDFFQIISVDNNYTEEIHAPTHIDIFWKNWQEHIHPDDWDGIVSALSKENLLSCFTQGKRKFSYYYRNKDEAGYIETQVNICLYMEADGDIAAFLLFRWKDRNERNA